ncbi:MAG: hypothetical protein KA338_21170 [Chloroflexi bacterium]|nr:hypothetical protein [Chloroflexota bacterium]
MSLEKTVVDTTAKSVKVAESFLKKAWSIMDAASQKETASQYLSDAGVKAMQGKRR